MAGSPLDRPPLIESLLWDETPGGNVEHISAHGVAPDDVRNVLASAPRFFEDKHDAQSIIAVGPNSRGRYLVVVLSPAFEPGEWAVATAHWLSARRGESLYRRGET